jgi:nucleotide-binding universal stress UspA family protein
VFRNILVAIDGSRHAARALAEAIDLAERNNARLAIITCVPDPSSWLLGGGAYGGGVNYAALREETDREYRDLLERAIGEVPQEIPVTKRLVHGRPGDRILEQMREGSHDLVVMGSRGRGNMRSMVLGSVSHQVLNAGPAAVLIVHTELERSRDAEGRAQGAADA